MRSLFTAACVCLLGCGGVDESMEPTASSSEAVLREDARALDRLPEPTLTWEAAWARIGLDAKLRAQALEGRAFYTVDLGGMTPTPTTPPCPACK